MVKQITELSKWIVTALYRSLRVPLLRLKVARFLPLSHAVYTSVHVCMHVRTHTHLHSK